MLYSFLGCEQEEGVGRELITGRGNKKALDEDLGAQCRAPREHLLVNTV